MLSASVTHADDVTLRALVSKNEVAIAEPFRLTLRVIAPRDSEVQFPETVKNLGVFEVADIEVSGDLPVVGSTEDVRLWTHLQTLTTLELGTQTVPPIEVQVTLPGEDKSKTFKSDAIEVYVVSVLDQQAQQDPTVFNEISGGIEPPAPDSELNSLPWWSFVIPAVLVFGFVLGVLINRRRRDMSVTQWGRRRLTELDKQLASSDSVTIEMIEELRSVLSTLVEAETYVRFGSQSTQQILTKCADVAEVHHYDRPTDFGKNLKRVFENVDRLKFGGNSILAVELSTFNSAIEETWQVLRWVEG